MGSHSEKGQREENAGVHDFPLRPIETLKLHLMNSAYYHARKTLAETKTLLDRDGDYLVQDFDDSSLILSTLVGEAVMEFKIALVQSSPLSPFKFAIAECADFPTLDELVLHFSMRGYYFECEGHQFRLVRPITRGKCSGRFGYGVAMKIRDQTNRKRIMASFVRSLRRDFAALPDVEGSLEALVQLDHRWDLGGRFQNLAMIHDFSRFEMGRGVSPLIAVRCDLFESNLFDHLYSLKGPLKTRSYVRWCYQVGRALDYLASNDILHCRLHPRACLLDSGRRIKLSGYWTRMDVDDSYLYQQANVLPNSISESVNMNRDGWRYLPIETLLSGTFDSASHLWSYALLIWQIFTHCQFTNRAFFTSLSEFLETGAADDELFMPGHLTRADANRGLPAERRRKITFYRMSDRLPRAPDSLAFRKKIPQCLARDASTRPSFEELYQVVENEHRIHKLSRLLSKFI